MDHLDLQVPELAYLFGFLQADGSLSKATRNRGRVTVELCLRDVEVLERFKDLLPVYSSITFRQRNTNFKKDYKTASWRLYDRDLREVLSALGLPYGKKSDVVAPPSHPFAKADYFRGFFDGDGSVGLTAQGWPFVSLPTSSSRMAAAFEAFWFGITGKHKRSEPNTRDAMYNLAVFKEDAQAIAREMYYPGCLALTRKMAAAEKMLRWVRPASMRKVTWERRRWTSEENAFVLGHAVQESVYTLGRTERSIRVQLCRLRKTCPSSTPSKR